MGKYSFILLKKEGRKKERKKENWKKVCRKTGEILLFVLWSALTTCRTADCMMLPSVLCV
jgi:hypothetical protein